MVEDEMKARVLDAALSHVPFDGWSERTLQAAIADLTAAASSRRNPMKASGHCHGRIAPTEWPFGVRTETFSNHLLTSAEGGARLLSMSPTRR